MTWEGGCAGFGEREWVMETAQHSGRVIAVRRHLEREYGLAEAETRRGESAKPAPVCAR